MGEEEGRTSAILTYATMLSGNRFPKVRRFLCYRALVGYQIRVVGELQWFSKLVWIGACRAIFRLRVFSANAQHLVMNVGICVCACLRQVNSKEHTRLIII
jgi:hypothetical protein